MITDIFKTSLYNVQIKKEKYVKYFLNNLKKEKKTNKKGVSISNKGGYQTFNFRGMDNKEVNREVFLKPAHAFCSKLNPRENTSFKIYTHSWWINENNFGDYNELHNHYINEDHLVLTGIYYLETPKESGDLIFQNQDFNKFNDSNFKLFKDANFHARYVWKPKKYDLLLFSPSQFHMVEPNRSKKSRISVAFNIGLLNV
jgi:uncharacterized protein (TIGR02466 family)